MTPQLYGLIIGSGIVRRYRARLVIRPRLFETIIGAIGAESEPVRGCKFSFMGAVRCQRPGACDDHAVGRADDCGRRDTLCVPISVTRRPVVDR